MGEGKFSESVMCVCVREIQFVYFSICLYQQKSTNFKRIFTILQNGKIVFTNEKQCSYKPNAKDMQTSYRKNSILCNKIFYYDIENFPIKKFAIQCRKITIISTIICTQKESYKNVHSIYGNIRCLLFLRVRTTHCLLT